MTSQSSHKIQSEKWERSGTINIPGGRRWRVAKSRSEFSRSTMSNFWTYMQFSKSIGLEWKLLKHLHYNSREVDDFYITILVHSPLQVKTQAKRVVNFSYGSWRRLLHVGNKMYKMLHKRWKQVKQKVNDFYLKVLPGFVLEISLTSME